MLISRSVQIPVFLRIGRSLLGSLPDLLEEHHLRFRSPLVVSSPRSRELAGLAVARILERRDCLVVRDNTRESVREVTDAALAQGADLIVGVGGGTPLDVAKYAAASVKVNFLSIPTTPSNDGIASPVAVIRNGSLPASLPARMPVGVIADLDVLRQAPPACVRAGIGDLLANISAVADWELACQRGRDTMDDFARLLAMAGAEAVLRFADNGHGPDPDSPELLETLLNGLVLSGVAMEIAGSSRPCSGAEHLFSHAVDRIAARPAMHGAQVGLGTLLMTTLRGDDYETLRASMMRLGVAVRATEVGILDDDVVQGLLQARSARPGRYTVLDEIAVSPREATSLAERAGVI